MNLGSRSDQRYDGRQIDKLTFAWISYKFIRSSSVTDADMSTINWQKKKKETKQKQKWNYSSNTRPPKRKYFRKF